MVGLLLNSARIVGLASACVAILLYGLMVPWPGVLMILLALAAAWASMTIRPFVLIAVSFASFFPLGLYLLFTPGILRWTALCDVLFLVAAGLMLIARGYQGFDSART